eukprot:gene22140-biopygen1156
MNSCALPILTAQCIWAQADLAILPGPAGWPSRAPKNELLWRLSLLKWLFRLWNASSCFRIKAERATSKAGTKSIKTSKFSTSWGCHQGAISDPDGVPTCLNTVPKTRARADLAILPGPAGAELAFQSTKNGTFVETQPLQEILSPLERKQLLPDQSRKSHFKRLSRHKSSFLVTKSYTVQRPRCVDTPRLQAREVGCGADRVCRPLCRMFPVTWSSVAASPGPPCICLMIALWAEDRSLHSEPKTHGRVEMAFGPPLPEVPNGRLEMPMWGPLAQCQRSEGIGFGFCGTVWMTTNLHGQHIICSVPRRLRRPTKYGFLAQTANGPYFF